MAISRQNIRVVGACFVCSFVASVPAKPIITIYCEEPEGPRIDVGGLPAKKSGKELNFSSDGFTGVHPTFIIDDTSTDTLTYLFDNTLPATVQGLSHKPARSAQVLTLNPQMITAIDYGRNMIAVFSLYPEAGFGFFTYHEVQPLGGADAKAVTYVSKCTFN